ncbi:heterokaryon incompatibility protein-domain-containing protein [Corynascus novoguineensis]|uniref:Heterokaryon incompatibility protein-domain-containing protein n=1 Tax=Corynascus novoguineensis TaxID=1126955 RepID=A0AAN7D0V8_9PEZI|nr:heterokaryon incompatibility protein-domain-containing protein [Corynascus novoguineensis]
MPTLSVSKVLKAHGQGEEQKPDEDGEDERVYHFAKSVQRLCPCCDTCRFCNNMVPKFKHRLIIELKDFATAASEGCHGCLLVTQAIEAIRTVYSNAVAAHIFGDPGAYKRWPWGDVPLAWDAVPPYAGDDAAFAKVLKWISACEASHPCYTDDSVSPTRVLDVTGNSVRLHNTSGNDKVRYVALSHSWASHAKFELLRCNSSDMARSIDCDELPVTYRDAITLTRRLGIRYIWIDSLCIVQDDKDDWRREAAKMADVYSNAYLTIAADLHTVTAGGDTKPADGCFSTVAPEHVGCELKLAHPESSNETYSVGVRKAIDHGGTLGKRGWVMQERWLSPRYLWYRNNDVIFQCREGYECLCGNWEGTSRYKALANDDWHKLVGDDRFPAISGIARSLWRKRKAGETDYLAGLWRDTLESDLLWRHNGNRFPRPAEWAAPTWSWASVLGHCVYRDNRFPKPYRRRHLRVRSAQCSPVVEADPFGQITAASLVLPAKLIGANLAYDPEDMKPDREYKCNLEFDHPQASEHVVPGTQKLMVDYNVWEDKAHHVPPGSSVAFLVLFSTPFPPPDSIWGSAPPSPTPASFCAGLILRAIDPDKAVYERIALCEIQFNRRHATSANPCVRLAPQPCESDIEIEGNPGEDAIELEDYWLGSWYENPPETVITIV